VNPSTAAFIRSYHHSPTTYRFIERVTNNVEICVTDIHCRLECGGADFHTDESKTAWPYFAVGLRVERFNMGRSAPADAKKVTTSFGIGKPIEMNAPAPLFFLSEFEGMSLYWDHGIPQCSIFSAGTSVRLDMRTEPSFGIFVAASSPSNPDLHDGDVILQIGDMHVPTSWREGQNNQQHVFDKYAMQPTSLFAWFTFLQVFCRTCIISRACYCHYPARSTCSSRNQDQAGFKPSSTSLT
jgi:hypothetical protein